VQTKQNILSLSTQHCKYTTYILFQC